MKSSEGKSKWLSLGAVLGAMGVSACCWLPPLLLLLGVGSVGLGSFFHQYQISFASGTLLLLGSAFYFTYRKPKKTNDNCGCAGPKRNSKANKAVLWITAVLVIGFFTYPYWMTGPGQETTASKNSPLLKDKSLLKRVEIHIEGMT